MQAREADQQFQMAICDRDMKFILNLRFNDINEIVIGVKNLDNDKKASSKDV